jgi:hypothetical protein
MNSYLEKDQRQYNCRETRVVNKNPVKCCKQLFVKPYNKASNDLVRKLWYVRHASSSKLTRVHKDVVLIAFNIIIKTLYNMITQLL